MAVNACNATPFIFTDFNWVTHTGGQSSTDTMTNLKINNILIEISLFIQLNSWSIKKLLKKKPK